MKQSHRQFRALRCKFNNRSAQAGLSGLVLLTGAMIAPPATAGNWTLDRYGLNGQNVWSPATTTQSPQIWESPVAAADAPNGIVKSATASQQGSGTGASFTVLSKSGGSITAVFKWIPAAGQTLATEPPPAYLDLLISSNATSQSYLQTNGSITYTWEAHLDNGKRQWNTPEIPINQTVSLQDRQLLRVAAGAETVEVTRQVNADNKIVTTSLPTTNSSGQSNYYGSANAGVSSQLTFKASPDDRTVKLQRNCAPAPKIKGGVGVVIDPLRDEWIDTNGDAYGHTRWSYKERQAAPPSGYCTTFYGDTAIPLATTINAEKIGGWSANITYSWTPAHALDTITEHIQDLPDGGAVKDPIGIVSSGVAGNGCPTYLPQPAGWYNVPSSSASNNGTLTVKYTLTDNNDSASATANYVLTQHDEWENWRPDPNWPNADRQTRFLPNPVPHSAWFGHLTEPIVGTWEYASQEASITAEMGFSPGFNLGDVFTFGVNFSASHTETIGAAAGIEATAPPNKMMHRTVEQSWIRQHYIVDHYEVCGWDKNVARSDGAWEQWWDDLSTISNRPTFSGVFNLGDYNQDGVVNELDDAVL